MHDSSSSLARLKRHIETLSGTGPRKAALFGLGLDALDVRLGGGLACATLHEVVGQDATPATGFALMLALRSAVPGRPILWVVADKGERLEGHIHAPGLVELGVNPDDLVMVHAPDDLAALQVAADIIGCAGVGAAIIDAGEAKRLDLTASRRLALAAEKSGVTGFVLRKGESRIASAASTRWQVTAAPSVALPGNAPGHTALRIALVRHRGGIAPFEMNLEWNRDTRSFCEPQSILSGAAPALSGGRKMAA